MTPEQELAARFQPVPGDYLPCIPLETVGRAWFWNGYSYGL